MERGQDSLVDYAWLQAPGNHTYATTPPNGLFGAASLAPPWLPSSSLAAPLSGTGAGSATAFGIANGGVAAAAASGDGDVGFVAVARDTSSFLSAADQQNVSALLEGSAWDSLNLTYSFPDSPSYYGTSQGTGPGQYPDADPFTGFSPLSSQQMSEVARAFALIRSYTNLNFTPITETSTTHATIRLGNTSLTTFKNGNPFTSEAAYPDSGVDNGDVFYGTTGRNPAIGNFDSAQAILHEIGHALGLEHGQGDGPDTYGVMNPNRLDIEFAVMNYPTYLGDAPDSATNLQAPQTYMMYDIAALQYMYGANFGLDGQDVTYTWSPTTGEEKAGDQLQGVPFDNHIFDTVWSAGAHSTYDLSGFSQDQVDDMTPGGWMLFSTAQLASLDDPNTPDDRSDDRLALGNVYNSLLYNGDPRSLIDDILTGSGNDRVIGNAADNVIKASAGNDWINAAGGDGNRVFGGAGADKFAFDPVILTGKFAQIAGAYTEIGDYDQGDAASATYNAAEHDQIDLSLLPGISDAYYKNGVPISQLVQVIEDKSGTFAQLWLNPSSFGANGQHFIPIATLDNFKVGNNANIILDVTQPGGIDLRATIPSLIFTNALGEDWNAVIFDEPAGTIAQTNWEPIQGANGSIGLVPSPDDDLLINNGHHVVISGGDYQGNIDQASSLTLAAGTSLDINDRLRLGVGANNSNEALTNDGVITVKTGYLQVAGDISGGGRIEVVGSPVEINQELLLIGSVTVKAGATITLAPAKGLGDYVALGGNDPNATATLINQGLLEGGGKVGDSNFSYAIDIVNNGTIDGNNDDDPLKIIGNPLNQMVNDGTIKATAIPGAVITSYTIVNVGSNGPGTLAAFGNGAVFGDTALVLAQVHLEGGLIATSGTGIVEFAQSPNFGANTLDGQTIGAVTITAGSNLVIGSGEKVTAFGTVINHGTFSLLSSDHSPTLGIGSGNFTLTGGGKLQLDSRSVEPAKIFGADPNSETTLHNVDNSISGHGILGSGTSDSDLTTDHLLHLQNDVAGTVIADDAAVALTLSARVTNNGLIEATGAAGLVVAYAFGEVIVDQSGGGTIAAFGTDGIGGVSATIGTKAHVDFGGATLIGGTLTTNALGVINIGHVTGGDRTTFDGTTTLLNNKGLVDVHSGTLVLEGTIRNTGSIMASNFGVIASQDATLIGGGTIRLNEGSDIVGGDAATMFLHNVDNTIAGAGWFGPTSNTTDGFLHIDNEVGGTIEANNPTAPLHLNTGTTVTNEGLIRVDNAATLVIHDALANSGQVKVDGGGLLDLPGTYSGNAIDVTGGATVNAEFNNTLNITFSGAGTLVLPDAATPDGFFGTVAGFTAGDTIDLTGLSFDSTYRVIAADSGTDLVTLNVTRNGDLNQTVAIAGHLSGSYVSANFLLSQDAGGNTLLSFAPTCFCRGTRILTARGEIPVEELSVGDLVQTLSGALKPIVWIGMGRDLVTRANKSARPVIVRRGALADNVPHRDLYLTHGHSLYLDEALIPVENLINHRSIMWDESARVVEHYHIELEDHDIVLAEGAAAETYYDAGNRALFHNTRPGSRPGPDKATYAPVLSGGERVDQVWARLFARSGGRIEQDTTDEADPHLVIEGVRFDASHSDGCIYRFELATPPTGRVRLCSRDAIPSLVGVSTRDHRRLGVAVAKIEMQAAGITTVLSHDAALLQAGGCHSPETDFTWTDGELALPERLFAHLGGEVTMLVHTERPGMRYPRNAVVREPGEIPAVAVA